MTKATYEAPSGKELADFLMNDEEETVETTPESQSETAVDEGTPSQEGQEEQPVETIDETQEDSALDKIPFHKHPRWIRMQRELKEAREALSKKSEQPVEVEQRQTQVDEDLPPTEFIKLFGDNPEAWKLWKRMQDSDRNKAVELARKEIHTVLAQQKEEQQRAEQNRQQILNTLEDELADISEDAGVDLTNPRSTVRNQILNIVEEYGLLGDKGIPNLRAAYRLHQKLYPKSSQGVEEKRKVVAKTNVKTNSNTEENIVYTPKRIKEIMRKGGIGFLENT